MSGSKCPKPPTPVTKAREIAAEVLATVEPRSDPWAHATACEACVALGDTEHAVVHGAAFVDDVDTDAFAIASLLRQLHRGLGAGYHHTTWQFAITRPAFGALGEGRRQGGRRHPGRRRFPT